MTRAVPFATPVETPVPLMSIRLDFILGRLLVSHPTLVAGNSSPSRLRRGVELDVSPTRRKSTRTWDSSRKHGSRRSLAGAVIEVDGDRATAAALTAPRSGPAADTPLPAPSRAAVAAPDPSRSS